MLAADAAEDARFFVVWVNPSPADLRDSIDPELLADERVTQYWDDTRAVGALFGDADPGRLGHSGFVYDVYYVFGPDASWADSLPPAVRAGAPVVSGVEELLAQL